MDPQRWALLAVLLLALCTTPAQQQDDEQTSKWAQELGDELWELGLQVTKKEEIKREYSKHNARTLIKTGDTMLNDIVAKMERMLQQKMNAVECIMKAAEADAEEFDFEETREFLYHSAKHSPMYVNGEFQEEEAEEASEDEEEEEEDEEYKKYFRFGSKNRTTPVYKELWLEESEHLFYGIPVNTSHSSVHVPENVFDHGFVVQAGLQWSEQLNDVFIQNYASDPSLLWQFFGHSSGFMRIFPAIGWKTVDDSEPDDGKDEDAEAPDLYDCRYREWYIEAATCTKDVVLLVDNTGSMTGVRSAIAKLTVTQILETFGANDFVSVLSYNDTVKSVVDCFDGTLVQGTAENKKAFVNALDDLKPEEYANLTNALIYALDLLEDFRENQRCPESHCNQAIMVITDGIAFNMTDFLLKYNRYENDTIPVRIFTFLLGKEVARVQEIQEMACRNRGYYMHVHALNEIREHVWKYVPVVARPLVLQEDDHPVRWSPAFADTADPKMSAWLMTVMREQEQVQRLGAHENSKRLYFSQRKEDNKYIQDFIEDDDGSGVFKFKEYRMMTTVSVPAFDRKWILLNETMRRADLLGVAGIDVPISDFVKLTMPYSIGVNGYVFIVTNNGYILTHPDHRPVYRGVLKTNYNSVDLTEIEFADEEREPRDPSPKILELRESMVNHSRTHMQIELKFHFEDMRRVDREMKDVYIAPLKGTPFSIAMVLPTEYGHAWLKVASDEFKKHMQIGMDPVTFFNTTMWRIHPQWDYCSYFHEDYKNFNTPEERVLHFVERASKKNWEWRERWRTSSEDNLDSCKKPVIERNDYYCDRELMQLLVFDARLSLPYYRTMKWEPKTRDEQELVKKYNVSLRFIAMQSGLTRWQVIQNRNIDNKPAPEWGDSNNHAIEESWYVGAVLQHQVNNYSFYFSMPSNTKKTDPVELSVTATHAIFHLDESRYVPSSVVGYVMPHASLQERFTNVTSKARKRSTPCSSEELNCYLLDGNGYILAGKSVTDTGRFFGEVEGAVLAEMVSAGLFTKRVVYDHQALCFIEVPVTGAANSLFTPLDQLSWLWQWTVGRMAWLLMQSEIGKVFAGDWFSDYLQDHWPGRDTPRRRVKRKKARQEEDQGEVFPRKPKPGQTRTVSYPCERKTELYRLEQEKLREGHFRLPSPSCSRPYSARSVPNSNMLLVVTNPMKSNTCFNRLFTESKVIEYNVSTPCQKMGLNDLPRRRLTGCYNYHPKEVDLMHQCGNCGLAVLNPAAVAASIALFFGLQYILRLR